MRPSILDPMFAPVTTLDGVGSKVALLLGNLLGSGGEIDVPRVGALVFHLPQGLIDRRTRPGIAFAAGGIVTLDFLLIDTNRHREASTACLTRYMGTTKQVKSR